jgi:hypothetical protein
LGSKEDDQTFGLGFVMSRSPKFLLGFVEMVSGHVIDGLDAATVALQAREAEHGRTDIQITVPDRFFGVIEAKIGLNFPSEEQLERYRSVIARHEAPRKILCAVTNLSELVAGVHVARLSDSVRGIPFKHVSWRQVRAVARAAHRVESHTNKRWLDEFITYLGEILGMDRRYSNMVYVVSLAQGNPEGWTLSWRDIVNQRGRYFYPVGGGWPDPPNYIAFRFDGRLQTIHHVEGYDLFEDPHAIFPEARSDSWPAHYCLRLGRPIRPHQEIPNGPTISRSIRVWCMLDLLLTGATITEALEKTKEREKGDREERRSLDQTDLRSTLQDVIG